MESPLFIENNIEISASTAQVWDALVNPSKTKVYMFGCEALSDWEVGSPLLWEGEYEGQKMVFVKGSIKEIIPAQKLVYTVFDPNSSLEDIPENHLDVIYQLTEKDNKTVLTVRQGDYNKVGDGEKRYQESYNNGQGWDPILQEIKKLVETAN